MNNQDYIHAAVELADGWQTTRLGDQRVKVLVPHGDGGKHPLRDIGSLHRQWVLDALAAQLVRQVVSAGYQVVVNYHDSGVFGLSIVNRPIKGSAQHFNTLDGLGEKFDFTMNTIKAIVDSGVLNEA